VTTQTDHAPSAGSHAVVIGGSMAGLLAGRVLAEHFDRVTIVERDRFPLGAEFRSGVPQARHAHILLARGRMILEQFFPTLMADLLAAGVPVLDTSADLKFLNPIGWLPRYRSNLSFFSCSRILLEWTVRQQLARYAGVRFAEGCDVVGLLPDAQNDVAGVRVRSRDQTNAGPPDVQELSADLVVDASGRSSRTPDWLQALGYPRAQETVINAFLGYASRVYARPSGVSHDWQALWLATRPPTLLRGGVIFPLEGERWMVTLVGAARDYPPTDEAGFLAFARSLASPLLYEAISAAQPLSPIHGYQRTENYQHHYERLARWPENFVVIGDAVCAFNPVYGQGMTVAALSAQTLDQALRAYRRRGAHGDLRGLARHVQRQLAKGNTTPWLMATGEDFRYPATEGGHPDRLTRLTHWYMDRVLLLCAEKVDVYNAFASVLHMLKPPSALFRPRILFQVLRYRAQERRALSAAS
jgi:2-polyprenyl-6-methoxyphenol hydroxylase-like FAD-dependent oxidoreductase